MGKFTVTIVDASNDYGPRNSLVVRYPDGRKAEFYDHGEPEDNTFDRDYSWIKPELERAYDAGWNAALEALDALVRQLEMDGRTNQGADVAAGALSAAIEVLRSQQRGGGE